MALAIGVSNVFVLLLWWAACGLPLLTIMGVRLGLFAQAAAVGLVCQTSIFLGLSAIGITAEHSAPWVVVGMVLLNVGLAVLPKHRLKLHLLVRDARKWFFAALVVAISIALLFLVQGYEAPILFFNKSDTQPYVALPDLFWTNLPFQEWAGILDYNRALLDSYLMGEVELYRAGVWATMAPSFFAFGARPLDFFFGLIIALWVVTAACAFGVVRLLHSAPIGTRLFWASFLAPFFVNTAFESYLSQTIFTPLFLLLFGLTAAYSTRWAASGSHARLRPVQIAVPSFLLSGIVLFYPEYSLPTALMILTTAMWFGRRAFADFTWPGLLFLHAQLWAAVGLAALLIGHRGFIKSVEDTLSRAGVTNYDTLKNAFPGFWVDYILNTVGAPLYPYFSEQAMGLLFLGFLALLLTIGAKPLNHTIRHLGVPFLVTVAGMAVLSSYGAVKQLAVWSALATPWFLFSMQKRTQLIFGAAFLAAIVAGPFAVQRYWVGYNYIYDYHHDMQDVADYVEKNHPDANILFLFKQQEMMGTLALMMARHKGELFSSQGVFGRWAVPNSKYGSDQLSSCAAIEEPLFVTVDFMLTENQAPWIRECVSQHRSVEIGKMVLVYMDSALPLPSD